MSNPFELDDLPEEEVPLSVQAMPLPPMPWMEGLNPEQHEAVTTTEGPVLVLSGAGTGKTRVLTTRLAYIMARRLAKPWHCLAVTFTNRAAREMRERVVAMVGPEAEGMWLGTFHALCLRILRRSADAVGLKSGFSILDADDQMRLLKQIMAESGVDFKKLPPQAVMGTIQRWKDQGLTPDKVPAAENPAALGFYRTYQERLKAANAVDFGDLLLHCLTLFLTHPDVLAHYQAQFRYVLVDEYQDTNVAQYLWLRLLAQKHRNICCVGDDDQSIYSWRGAEVGNILKFDKDFDGAKIIRLERNYRSTSRILEAASGLISHNDTRLGKTLRPGLKETEPVEKVVIRGLWDGAEEARVIVEEIESLQRSGHTLKEIAILVRAGFQTREFEERLIANGVPYAVIGGPRFYERMEVRDAMAYLRLVVSADDSLAFERILNTPKRGLGSAALQTIHLLARDQDISYPEAARRLCETDELRPAARKALGGLLEMLGRWRALLEGMEPAELAATVLAESGYEMMWKADKSLDAPGRLENLKELVATLENYTSLQEFLEHVALVMENDAAVTEDRIFLMTLHSAKGLEFETVFLPGWEEGLFPHQRALDEGGVQGLEEERRLAYVGLTRGKKRAQISFAANRRIYNQWQSTLPSRFIDELPPSAVEVRSERGVYGAGRQASFVGSGSRSVSSVDRPARERAEPVQSKYSVDMRVFHQKFGYGDIQAIDGNKLEILFDKAGLKKVIDSFVQKA